MIEINLLPEEYRERVLHIPVPLREIAWALGALLILVWLFTGHGQGQIRKETKSLEAAYRGLLPEVEKAEALLAEMNGEILPKKNFLDRFDMPESQWDHILNVVSDAVPETIWFRSLELSSEPAFSLRIEGLAVPDRQRSAMEWIGEFITRAKKDLESFVAQQSPDKAVELATETFTQQEEVEKVKVTKFMVEFKKT